MDKVSDFPPILMKSYDVMATYKNSFSSFQQNMGSDVDSIQLHKTRLNDVCHMDKGQTYYIDARLVNNGKPWDSTDELLNKVSPQ